MEQRHREGEEKGGQHNKDECRKARQKQKGLYVSRMLLNSKQVENAVVGFRAGRRVSTWSLNYLNFIAKQKEKL